MAADSEKLAGALLDAQVDLNPHQVEAALFAFKSPLAKSAILADVVGLGKTIEAGLIHAQKWSEGKRRILVICSANLRKQWSQEIAEKYRVHIPEDIDVKAIREATGLTQEAFALRYGFNLGRLRDLEQKRTRPDSVVRAYLLVIQKNPEAVKEALAA